MHLELPPGISLGEVLGILEIDLPVDGLLLLVNGKNSAVNYLLNDGDIVHIIPALSGG